MLCVSRKQALVLQIIRTSFFALFLLQDVFCSTKPSWQGGRCAPPLHPPGRGSVGALNPSRASGTYRRSITRGRLRSPCTHRSFQEDQGLSRPLKPTRNVWPLHHQSGVRSCSPDTPMTISWRRLHRDQERELSRCPSLEPSHRPRSLRAPWNPDQSCADWMPPTCRRWITAKAHAAPWKHAGTTL